MNFFVEPEDGHDDFLSSLLLLFSASEYRPRVAKGGNEGAKTPCREGPHWLLSPKEKKIYALSRG